jgi:hypothetical protein
MILDYIEAGLEENEKKTKSKGTPTHELKTGITNGGGRWYIAPTLPLLSNISPYYTGQRAHVLRLGGYSFYAVASISLWTTSYICLIEVF